MAKVGLLTLILFLLSSTVVAAVDARDDWPMYQHDSSHSGYSSVDAVSNPVYLWNFSALEGFVNGVAVSGGSIFFTAYNTGNVFALNASTGQLIWKSNSTAEFPVMSCPAVMNGVVYTATDAYNASTGQLIFNYTGGDTSPVVVNDVIYLGGTSDNRASVMALNAKTGALIWNFPVQYLTTLFPAGMVSTPIVSNGVVYFSGDGVYALDAETGHMKWHFGEAGSGWSELSKANGRLYVINLGNMYCIDAVTGRKVWNFTIGVSQTPSVDTDYVYAGSYALNASSGALIWNNQLTGLSAPVVADGVVYYNHYRYTDEGSHGNWIKQDLLAFNSSTGHMMSNYTFPEVNNYQSGGSLAIANGNLYVTEGATIHAFSISELPPNGGSVGPTATNLSFIVPLAIAAIIGVFLLLVALNRKKKPK